MQLPQHHHGNNRERILSDKSGIPKIPWNGLCFMDLETAKLFNINILNQLNILILNQLNILIFSEFNIMIFRKLNILIFWSVPFPSQHSQGKVTLEHSQLQVLPSPFPSPGIIFHGSSFMFLLLD